MAFNGKLVEIKSNNSYTEFPLKYIQAESYKVTPDQRMEVNANRATTGLLVRNTVPHTASKIDFTTIPITNSDVSIIMSLLSSAYIDASQRKLELRYYVPDTDSYKTGTFYVPDIEYEIIRIDVTTSTIFYSGVRIAFIEY